MSEANLLLVKSFFEARVHGDLEIYLSFFDSEAEIETSEVYSRTVYRGLDEITRLFQESNAPWEDMRFQTANALSVGDRVVIDVTRTARARRGGYEVQSGGTAGITVRNGKILTYKLFQTRDAALEAAGLGDFP